MPDSIEIIERRKRVRIEPATPADARRIAAKLAYGGTYVPDDIVRFLNSLADKLEAAELLVGLAAATARAVADARVAEAQTDAAELTRLRAETASLRALIARYRSETPLGHQPHMIAHGVDKALETHNAGAQREP